MINTKSISLKGNVSSRDEYMSIYSLVHVFIVTFLAGFAVNQIFSGFQYGSDFDYIMLFSCSALASVFSYLTKYIKNKAIYFVSVLVVAGFYLVYFVDELYIGFTNFLRLIIQKYNSMFIFDLPVPEHIQQIDPNIDYESIILFFVFMLISFIFSMLYTYKTGFSLSLILFAIQIIIVLTVVSDLFALGVSFAWFLSVITIYVNCFKSTKKNYSIILPKSQEKKHVTVSKNGLRICATLMTVMLISSYIIGNYFNEDDEYMIGVGIFSEIRQTVESFVNTLNTDYNSLGVNGGVLTSASQRIINDTVHLEIIAEDLEPMYLRAYTGAVYNNAIWEDLPQENYEEVAVIQESLANEYRSTNEIINSSSNFMNYNTQIKNINIRNVAANNRFSYLPYYMFTDDCNSSVFNSSDFDYDKLIKNDTIGNEYNIDYYFVHKGANYSLSYDFLTYDDFQMYLENRTDELEDINNLGFGKWVHLLYDYYDSVNYDNQTYLTEHLDYMEFVYENYLDIPEELAFLEGYVEENIDLTKLYNVAKHLEDIAYYSQSPGAVPPGEDFVEYFLLDNKKGYCSHFATAATLMYRALGIPARYVEGYVVTEDDIETLTAEDGTTYEQAIIPDRNAHAWVEIFDYTLKAWTPIEVTPGFSHETIGEDEEIEPETSLEPESSVAPQVSEIPQSSVEPTQSSVPATTKPTGTPSTEIGNDNTQEYNYDWVYVVLMIVLPIISVILTYAIQKKIRQDKYFRLVSGKNKNLAFVTIYKHLVRQYRFLGFVYENNETDIQFIERLKNSEIKSAISNIELNKILSIALKAKFSKSKISDRNIIETARFLYKNDIYLRENLTGFKKLLYKITSFKYIYVLK